MAEDAGDVGAARRVVGVVAELWRYPVKSLQGERVRSGDLDPRGLAGDRRFGLIGAGGVLLSAKSVPELLTAGARTEGDEVVITLPDGTEVSASDGDASALLSRWLGREVELRETGAGELSFEMTFDPPNDDAELVSWPARPDSFLDSAPVNALTTSGLAQMTAVAPDTRVGRAPIPAQRGGRHRHRAGIRGGRLGGSRRGPRSRRRCPARRHGLRPLRHAPAGAIGLGRGAGARA